MSEKVSGAIEAERVSEECVGFGVAVFGFL